MRRRRVLRVAGAYTVAGWIVLQVAEVLMPALALPDWTLTFVAVTLLMGLPIAMVLVWALQPAAPQTAGALDASGEAPAGNRWLDAALLAGVVGVAGLAAAEFFSRGGDGAHETAPAASAAPSIAPATVAVLPFASFSDEADDTYFADGLTEELINGLAQLDGLRVPGRTSSFHFKGRNEDLRDIGRQLGVAHVLEGSVRRSGEKLRVTVQLVSTADGFHLWSRTYDRELTDVFAIQDDIASQVAAALKLTLLPPEADRPRGESATHPSFLIATALLRERTARSLAEARTLFEDVLKANPDHPEALAGFAEATILLASAYLTLDFEPAAAAAVDAVERAMALDPDNVAASLAAGVVYESLAFRTDEHHYLVLAERALSRAMALAPNDPEVLRTYGALLVQLGRWDQALAATRRAVAGDPLNRPARFQLVQALRGAGKLGEARAELEGMLEQDPDYLGAQLDLGELLVGTGAFEAALPHLKRAHAARAAPRATFALAHLYLNVGDLPAVHRTLGELDYAPLTQPLAEMVRHLLIGDDAATLAFAKAELARSGDRIWRPMIVLFALMQGDLETAREQLRHHEPAVLAPQPDIGRMAPSSVLLAANLLTREQRTAEATALLEQLLARLAPPQQGYDPVENKVLRAHAQAQLGRADAALAELEAARLQGYRTIYDFDYFLRLDRYPTFAALRGDRRFVDFIAGIEEDNRRLAPRLAAAETP